ncbi:MAG: tRNA(Ile)-lysidine synthase [Patescibacteria group bacterium]|nr:tRNA(Ile)-lysidine synthase [Patescibacteria group bacterium]
MVALSGGSDSVALLLSAADYFGKENVTAAHFNHRLRGDESDTDARFCEELCKKLGVRFESKEEDVLAFSKERKTGIEDAARTLRYAFLKTIASRIGASCILTGHTADDLAETVLANFLR